MKKCQQIISSDPKSAVAYYRMAVLCFEKADVEGAKTNLLKVNELAPDFNPDKVLLGLGEIFEIQKDWENSLKYYKMLYKEITDKQPTLLKIAKCFSKLGEIESSIKTYEHAILTNTKNFYPYYKLGWLQAKNKKLKEGVDNLTKALSLDNNNLNILIKLGEAYLMFEDDEEKTDEAISYLLRAIDMDTKNYDCLIGLGKAYETKGDIEKAI